jgi:MraZ protein
MLLTGAFDRSLDEKMRVAMPKRLREGLGEGPAQGMYLTPGTDHSLALYGEEAFARLAERLKQVSPARQDVRAFTRLFYARAQRVEVDAQGRVRIPQELAELASLGKEIVLLGVQDHVEIWAAERWASYLAERQGHYDEIAETALQDRSTFEAS